MVIDWGENCVIRPGDKFIVSTTGEEVKVLRLYSEYDRGLVKGTGEDAEFDEGEFASTMVDVEVNNREETMDVDTFINSVEERVDEN